MILEAEGMEYVTSELRYTAPIDHISWLAFAANVLVLRRRKTTTYYCTSED
jgi:hypothetical protein